MSELHCSSLVVKLMLRPLLAAAVAMVSVMTVTMKAATVRLLALLAAVVF